MWGLGTWGRETLNTGTWGPLMIIAKVSVKCDISFFVKMCYLLSNIFCNVLLVSQEYVNKVA